MERDVREALELLTQRIRVIEANIGVLAQQAGLAIEAPADPAQTIPQDVIDLATSGKKIEAIKRYREYVPTADLAEAKAIVDRI